MAAGISVKSFGFGNHTDTGQLRQVNEDYLGYFDTRNGDVFVVCDGMGGHVGGATASRIAVESIRTFFEHEDYKLPKEAVRQGVLFANQQVHEYALQHPELQGMGTTCVLVLVQRGVAYYAHVGDSRLYLHHQGQLSRLTKDHSFVQKLVDEGVISEAEAEEHPRRNEITRALGVGYEVEVDTGTLTPEPGDTLLLCSDGLFGMTGDVLIGQTLADNLSVQHKALKLVQLANAAGGTDNITVQLIRFEETLTPVAALAPSGESDTMTPSKNKTKQAAKGPDIALIVLCVLFTAVLILIYTGLDNMSANPPTSELGTGQLDTNAMAEDTLLNAPTTAVSETGTNTGQTTTETQPDPKPIEEVAETKPVVSASADTVIAHTVVAGENLSRISERYNIRKATVQQLNGMADEVVKIDQKLKVKVRAVHTVQKGDVLSVVADKYKVSKDLILRANSRTETKTTRGEKLIIPFNKPQ